MPCITIKIQNAKGETLAKQSGNRPHLVYSERYQEGDRIILETSDEEHFLFIQLDDVMSPAYVFMKESRFIFAIPFAKKKVAYNPKAFAGDIHVISARFALKEECVGYRNLALNEYDCHANTSCFPHAYANVETRGESVFAASNAINGNLANRSHGAWPYESWGINQNPNAELTISFGRMVLVDRIVLTTRADFPHDNWWKEGEVLFSDESVLQLSMEKSNEAHFFQFPPKTISWLCLRKLVKDETDSSPFPALTQIEVYGKEVSYV